MNKLLDYSSVYFVSQVNILIHYLERIPFIGKFISDKIYGMYQGKKLCFFFGICYGLLKRILVANIEVIILLYLIPKYVYKERQIGNGVYIVLFVVIECICIAINECNLFSSSAEDYSFLTHFMVNPNSYYKYKILKNLFDKGLFKVFGVAWVVRSPISVSVLIIVKCTCSVWGDLLHLQYFLKKGKSANKYLRRLFSCVIALLAYAIGYAGAFDVVNISNLCGVLFGIIACVLLGIGLWNLLHFNEYKRVAISFADQKVISFRVSVGGDESDYTLKEDYWEHNKEYFEKNKNLPMEVYFDKTFFLRYKKVLLKDFFSQLIFYMIVFWGGGLFVRNGIIKISLSNVMEYSTILLYSMLGLGVATKYSKLFFRNIDVFMMNNHVCSKEYVKRSMLQRYKYLLVADFLLTLFASCYLWLFEVSSGIFLEVKTNIFMIIACGIYLVIWETYEMAIYYYVQPYSYEMTAKKPVYTILGYFELVMNSLVIFVRTDISKAIIYMLVFAVVEIVLFVGCSGKAYKLFKLR